MLSSTHFVRSAPALNEPPRLLACKSEGFTSTANMVFTSRDALPALFLSPSAPIIQDNFGKRCTVVGVSSSEVSANDTVNISLDLGLDGDNLPSDIPLNSLRFQCSPLCGLRIHGRLLLLKQADRPSGEFKYRLHRQGRCPASHSTCAVKARKVGKIPSFPSQLNVFSGLGVSFSANSSILFKTVCFHHHL